MKPARHCHSISHLGNAGHLFQKFKWLAAGTVVLTKKEVQSRRLSNSKLVTWSHENIGERMAFVCDTQVIHHPKGDCVVQGTIWKEKRLLPGCTLLMWVLPQPWFAEEQEDSRQFRPSQHQLSKKPTPRSSMELIFLTKTVQCIPPPSRPTDGTFESSCGCLTELFMPVGSLPQS